MSTGTGTGQRRRRRVQLTPMRPVPVEFTGVRAGEGPLTLGQLNIYNWLSQAPDELAHLGSWRHLPVRVEGSGRA